MSRSLVKCSERLHFSRTWCTCGKMPISNLGSSGAGLYHILGVDRSALVPGTSVSGTGGGSSSTTSGSSVVVEVAVVAVA